VYFLAVAQRGLPDILPLERSLFPREADVVRTRGDGDTAGHARVDQNLRLIHVLRLDFVVLGTADLSGIHLGTVHGDDERVRLVISLNAGVALLHSPDQSPRELVLRVGWKHMTDQGAAACAERQAINVAALSKFAADRVLRRSGTHARVAHGQRADALRGGDIPFEQERRRLQRSGVVVEAEVGSVARQPLGDVDVQPQQIADHVRIFAAIQTMHDVPARGVAPLPGTVERSGEPARKAHILAFNRVRYALGRHCARTQLAEHAFPGFGLGQHVVETGRFEVHRRIGWRRRPAVMTAHAILVQPRAVFCRFRRLSGRLRARGSGRLRASLRRRRLDSTYGRH
jgi:hypothetical protein